MKHAEPSIRLTLGLFSLLLGLGLKHVIDGGPVDELGIAAGSVSSPGTMPVTGFALALFLFLRYLTGSANHLWHVYQREGAAGSRAAFFKDLGFVVVFGLIGLVICYSPEIQKFLFWNLVLLTVALGWLGWEYIGAQRAANRAGRLKWLRLWSLINALQWLSVLAALSLRHAAIDHYILVPGVIGPISLILSVLLVVYILLFVVDFQFQLKTIGIR